MRAIITYFVNVVGRALGRDSLWMSIQATKLSRRLEEAFWGTVELVVTYPTRRKLAPIVDRSQSMQPNTVDRHWQSHTIRGRFFLRRQDSLDYIKQLTDGRPFKRQLLLLHGPHTGKVILDYGCGPGNDLAGFAEFSGAARIIGIDISRRALRQARARVSWHTREANLFEFIKIRDEDTIIPLGERSVDYIQSLGVIHHTSRPDKIFAEFARILRPNGEIRIMLYNADSIYIQLTIGYLRRLIHGLQSNMTPEKAFEQSADLEAPIAHCVRPADVLAWVSDSGLTCEFLGGYFVPGEREDFRQFRSEALTHPRLSDEQREFLANLAEDQNGFPFYRGKPAGLGGVYRLMLQ